MNIHEAFVFTVFATAIASFVVNDEIGLKVRALSATLTVVRWWSGLAMPDREFVRPWIFNMTTAPRCNPEKCTVYDVELPNWHRRVNIRVWSPAGLQKGSKTRAIVYFHGGGFVLGRGNDFSSDSVCKIVVERGFVCASVDYSLAPERPFPAAPEDCDAATRWILKGGIPEISPNAVCVMGDSAGANLASVVSMLARDRIRNGTATGEAPIRRQVLIYPGFPGHEKTGSLERLKDAWFIGKDVHLWFTRTYFKSVGGKLPQDPWTAALAIPAKSPNGLSGMPQTILVTAGLCPLQDEGVGFARKLEASGVKVAHEHFPRAVHGFMTFGTADAARAWDFIFGKL